MSKESQNEDSQPEEQGATASYDIPACGPGTEIGHFRIEEEIGRCGMGVAYLAQDTKLDRQVAIKSIPPIISQDEEVKRYDQINGRVKFAELYGKSGLMSQVR